MNKKSIPGWGKDDKGIYNPKPIQESTKDSSHVEVSIDYLLSRQLEALDNVTTQLLGASKNGFLEKDEIQSLTMCIKLTLELKQKENDLLKDLSDDELQAILKKS